MFNYAYYSLLVFIYVYNFQLLLVYLCLPMFTRAHLCLLVIINFANVYLCVPMFTTGDSLLSLDLENGSHVATLFKVNNSIITHLDGVF